MADSRQTYGTPTRTGVDVGSFDLGLRNYMLGVYNYMMLGLLVTAAAAYGIYTASFVEQGGQVVGLTSFGHTLFATPLVWVLMLAPLAVVMVMSFGINRLSAGTAQTLFWVYAALVGVSLSTLFVVYAHGSIARVFLITAAMFGATSLWGYTTKRDLTSMGSFLMMGLFGLIIASLVNLFWPSGALSFAISVLGVIIFAGLTAWDTQKIKEQYYAGGDEEFVSKGKIMGALNLYLDFINMFIMLLRLIGDRR
ncbi:MAG: Bax inhibitor-1/YccA family protein [Alphaproteobacteria bacterium]|nr:Bax inhibitor-1/YccA family protein [Alphaproteobacteria bacterium]